MSNCLLQRLRIFADGLFELSFNTSHTTPCASVSNLDSIPASKGDGGVMWLTSLDHDPGCFAILPLPHVQESIDFIRYASSLETPPDGFAAATAMGEIALEPLLCSDQRHAHYSG